MDDIDVELRPLPSTEHLLVAPSQRRYGPGKQANGELATKGVRVSIGRRPVVRNLRKLYALAGGLVPKDFELFDLDEIWLLTFTAGVMEQGSTELVRLDFTIRFDEVPPVTILSVAPETEFIQRAHGQWTNKLSIGLNGEASTAVLASNVAQVAGIPVDALSVLPLGGTVVASTKLDAAVTLSFVVNSARITATGPGHTVAQWQVRRHDKPLVGTNQFVVVLLAPKSQACLMAQCEVSGTGRGWLGLPVQLQTAKTRVEIPLATRVGPQATLAEVASKAG